jgi:xylulokinase
MTRLVAGVDCSTQSTKVVLVDVETGRVVAQGHAPHAVEGSDGARETHPDVWWEALRKALAQTERAAEVAAISIAGQQHGLVCLDGSGRPIRPAALWNDTRAGPDAARLVQALGGGAAWAERVGIVPVASFTASKWAWLRRVEPDAAARTAAIRLPHDYMTGLLTGNGVTDRGDASGTAWWSTATEGYLPEVMALPELSLDAALLPRVLGPGEAAGTVTEQAAAATGLPAGAVVGPGTGDNMGAALGLGLRPGVPTVSLGTSGTVFMVSETRPVDPSGDVAGFADATGRFLPLACTLNCTLAVDRVAAWLNLQRDEVAPSEGVVALPYFDGERTPNLPSAAAAVFGMRHDTSPRAILMATYEGVAVSLLDALDTIDRCSSGVDPAAPLVLVGGGAKGRTWQEVVRRLSGRPVSIPEATELVAIGAAVQAAAVLLGQAPQDVAERWQTGHGTLLPAIERDSSAIERHREVRRLAIPAVAGEDERA